MKCGKDLDETAQQENLIDHSNVPPEILEPRTRGGDSFLPTQDDEYSRLGPTARKQARGPVLDVASYKEAAAASAAAWEAEQEQASILESQAGAPAPEEDHRLLLKDRPQHTEDSEIRHTDLHADFADKKKFCHRCGMANPRDQRFCKNCGSALTDSNEAMADKYHDAGQMAMPAASMSVETTTLSDVSPSSAYSDVQHQGERYRRRSYSSGGGALANFGVREWSALIVGALVVAFAMWLFLFGGLTLLFNSGKRDITKAGGTMEKLPSFQYNISGAFESGQGQYPGVGRSVFETPDKTAWEFTRNGPAGPKVVGTTQVGLQTFMNSTGTWVIGDPSTATGDITSMWEKPRSIEKFKNEAVGNRPNCYHYKYRTDPNLMLTVLGLPPQEGVSDAIVEVWIDASSFQVARQTAQLIGAQIEGARTRVTLTMDLVETGKPYGIKPPG